MTSTSTVYLVTGANRARDIGLAPVSRILETQTNAFVYTVVRHPPKNSSPAGPSVGSSTTVEVSLRAPVPGVYYGSTKAALDWISRKSRIDRSGLPIIAWRRCDGLNDTVAKEPSSVFKTSILEDEPTPDEAAALIIRLIDQTTRKEHGGEFMHLDSTEWHRIRVLVVAQKQLA